MKKTILPFLIIWTSFFIYIDSYSQLSSGELPSTFIDTSLFLSPSQESAIIKSYSIDTTISEDSTTEFFQFGNSINVSLDLTNSGLWRTLPNGDRLWTLIIECPNAKSINLLYDEFWLPNGAKLFLYNKESRKK